MKRFGEVLLIAATIMLMVTLYSLDQTEKQLDDCRFECNHLETQVFYLRELNDYIPAMEQILTPLQLAELKTLSEQIRQKKHREHERIEQPIITKE